MIVIAKSFLEVEVDFLRSIVFLGKKPFVFFVRSKCVVICDWKTIFNIAIVLRITIFPSGL